MTYQPRDTGVLSPCHRVSREIGMTKHSMDDNTGFEATDEEMGLKPSGHTPGPWATMRAARPSDGGWDWGIFAAVNASSTKCIAEAFEVVDRGITAPAEANARLIAAAPDMLEALRGALVAIECTPSPEGAGKKFCDAITERRNAVVAAIAKAEGRS